MRNEYFTLIEDGDVQFGIVNNIPDDVTKEMVAERINATGENCSVTLTDEVYDNHCLDIEFDWQDLDIFENNENK
jgi:hypothetical protein